MRYVRKVALVLFVLAFLVSTAGFSASVTADNGQNNPALPDRLLVKFQPGINANIMAQVHARVGGEFDSIITGLGVQVITVPGGQGAARLAAYRMQKEVKYAEYDSVAQIAEIPNDPYFGNQWGLTKVQAPQAWDITHGSSNIRIAVLDTGIEMNHPDLLGKIVSNINFTDGIDADDYYGHGTHVAGIAGATANNGIGVSGLGYDCSLMNVKVLGDDGYGDYSWVAQGIIWAADNGANVINLSLGGSSPSATMEDAVNYAWSKGVVVVAAAGNSGNDVPFYPAYYTNCIAVGATDSNDNLGEFSNHGTWVDVAAPGVLIYSAVPSQQDPSMYEYETGTSMASPYVAGLAGLVFSVTSDANGDGKLNDEVRSKIETTCDRVGIDVAWGRIDAYFAVQGIQPNPTGRIAGVVTNMANGDPIGGATVTDGTRSATTNWGGYYCITDVPVGTYTLTASVSGYMVSSKDGVQVDAGIVTTVDFLLIRETLQANTMWVDGITFASNGKNLMISVTVVNPDPVSKAAVSINITQNGALCAELSGSTNRTGVATFRLRQPDNGTYTATVVALTSKLYVWDQSKGLVSGSYYKGN